MQGLLGNAVGDALLVSSVPHDHWAHQGGPPATYAPKRELCGAGWLGPRVPGPEPTVEQLPCTSHVTNGVAVTGEGV